MTTHALTDALTAQPFKPFTFVMSDGRRHHVPHREYVFYPAKDQICIVYEVDDVGHYRWVDLVLVSELEFGGPVPQRQVQQAG